MPSRTPEGETRGWIVPIGGAENKENDRHILERFVRVSGGDAANIVVIPTASRMHETGPRYEKLFTELGAAQVAIMDFDTRRDCQEPGRLQRLEEATGIFFTGGNQLRLTTLLGGTPVAKLIRVRNARGVAVGGTSAGRQHPERTHDRLWRRGLGGDLRQRAARAGPGTHQSLHHRPALPRARPPRPADHRAGLQPVCHRHRPRRGHRRLRRPGRDHRSRRERRRDGRGRCRCQLFIDQRGGRGPAGVHPGAALAHSDRRCDLQPAHAPGGCVGTPIRAKE